MNILLFDNGTEYQNKILSLLNRFGEVTTANNAELLRFSGADLVVLSGGHHTYITERPEVYKTETDFIKNTNKPILGICLGAEQVAYTFNAKLEFLEQKVKGLVEIEVLGHDQIFCGINNFKVYENHHVAITSLSNDLTGLAKSSTGYEVIKHKTKQLYGFQFHPEMFEEQTFGDEIFSNVLTLLKK